MQMISEKVAELTSGYLLPKKPLFMFIIKEKCSLPYYPR